MLAMVEAKIAADSPIPKVFGYNSVMYEHTRLSSGILSYSSVSCQVIKKFKYNKEGSMMLFSNVTLFGGLRVCVGIVYMKPGVSVEVFMQALAVVEKALACGKPLLLVGDFNCRHPQLRARLQKPTNLFLFWVHMH